jgi:hypothetical protein
MNRVCDAGGICGHTPQCDHFCHFTAAELEPEVVRKIKPWPVVPDDIEPVPESWQSLGGFLLGAALAMLIGLSLLMLFTGIWIWSLLI